MGEIFSCGKNQQNLYVEEQCQDVYYGPEN